MKNSVALLRMLICRAIFCRKFDFAGARPALRGRDIACKHAATFAGAKLVDYTVLLTRTACHLRGRDIACKHAATFADAKLVDYSVRYMRTACHLRGRDIACKHAATFAGAKLVDYTVRLHAHGLPLVWQG